jgi:hypothetical protein
MLTESAAETSAFCHVNEYGLIAFQHVKPNSVGLVRERTIPTERPPFVGEASANFFGLKVSRGQLLIPTAVL